MSTEVESELLNVAPNEISAEFPKIETPPEVVEEALQLSLVVMVDPVTAPVA
jgi:hypothetical protein